MVEFNGKVLKFSPASNRKATQIGLTNKKDVLLHVTYNLGVG